MKLDATIIGVMFMVMAYCIWGLQRSNADSVLENEIQSEKYNKVDSLYRAQSQVNLRIIQVINDSEQRKLKKDSIYMELLTKIN